MPTQNMTVTHQESIYTYEMSSFHTHWWKYLAPKFRITAQLQDLLVWEKPLFKNTFSLNEMRVSGWNNAWSQDFSEERVRRFFQFAQHARWDYFKLKWNHSRKTHQAFGLLEEMGYRPVHLPAEPEYIMDLSRGFDGYFESISHNTRKSFRRKVKRAEALNPQLIEYQGQEQIEPYFETFFRYHIQYWDQKAGHSYFHDPHEQEFIVNWSKQLQTTGYLHLEHLEMNGENVSMSHSILSGDTLYWLLTINTNQYQEYFPGIVGLYMRAKHMAQVGIRKINMGAGGYFYKVQAANAQEECSTLLIPNPKSLVGNLYVEWACRQQQK